MERSPRSVLPFSLKAYDFLWKVCESDTSGATHGLDNISIVASLDIFNRSASLRRDLSLPVENLATSGAA